MPQRMGRSGFGGDMYGLFLLNSEGERAQVAWATADKVSTLEKVAERNGFDWWIVLRIEWN